MNWERKSRWLLAETVKYETYIDSLQSAMALRLKKRGEKALERALDDVPAVPRSQKPGWKGRPEEDTIVEGDEPPPTPMLGGLPRSQMHRREHAEVEV